MRIVRRLDQTPACGENNSCPAVFVLEDGSIAVIGAVASDEVKASIPEGSGVGEGEVLSVIPREVLIEAGWTELVRESAGSW
jgi:hypothetical protein